MQIYLTHRPLINPMTQQQRGYLVVKSQDKLKMTQDLQITFLRAVHFQPGSQSRDDTFQKKRALRVKLMPLLNHFLVGLSNRPPTNDLQTPLHNNKKKVIK